jgi:hypothetical protein
MAAAWRKLVGSSLAYIRHSLIKNVIAFCQTSNLHHPRLNNTSFHVQLSRMYHFVTINHPSEAKDRKRQTELRQHAIRSGIRSKQVESAKCNENFVAAEVENGKLKKIRNKKKVAGVARPIDADLLDPFDALYGSGKRLRKFMDKSRC